MYFGKEILEGADVETFKPIFNYKYNGEDVSAEDKNYLYSSEGQVIGDNSELAVFSDTKGHKYEDSISILKKRGLIDGGNGRNSFRTDASINRAEFLTIVINSLEVEIDEDIYSGCFPDVNDEWFAPYVCYAKEQGYVDGYDDGTFKPAQYINYVEALKIVYESRNNQGKVDLNGDDWYSPYLEDAEDRSLISITDPSKRVTRGEIVEIIVRFLDWDLVGEAVSN